MKVEILPDETLIEALRRTLGREPTYEDVILAFGGHYCGQSIVEPRRAVPGRQDNGLKDLEQS